MNAYVGLLYYVPVMLFEYPSVPIDCRYDWWYTKLGRMVSFVKTHIRCLPCTPCHSSAGCLQPLRLHRNHPLGYCKLCTKHMWYTGRVTHYTKLMGFDGNHPGYGLCHCHFEANTLRILGNDLLHNLFTIFSSTGALTWVHLVEHCG